MPASSSGRIRFIDVARPWPFALHWDSVRWDIESFHATLIDGIDRQLDARALLCGSGESGQ